MAVSISISIAQNSQSIANNTSNVTVTVKASWTNGSWNAVVGAGDIPQANGSCTINGTKYTFNKTFNESHTTTGSETIFTKTLTISHNADGTKTLSCSAVYNVYLTSATSVSASASKALTTIPRKSTLSASNGTLGTSQKLTVTRQATSFTHTITYECGTVSGTVCSKSSSTSIDWTPALSLANQNTTGTSVTVTFTITTYSGSTNVGSNTKTITCAIPSSVKPSCSVSVSDPTGYEATYKAFVRGLSQFKVVVTATTSYGSPISTYKTTANGGTYTTSSFTTGVLSSSGTLKVSATVTDKRNRTGSATGSVAVVDYSAPVISKLTVGRCDSNGTAKESGDHVKVTFSASVTNINSKSLNAATYTLRYKKSTDGTYTTKTFSSSEITNKYSVTNKTFIFAADTGSSYNVELTVKDSHKTTTRYTTASTGFAIMHFSAGGTGIGIGKVSETENLLDIGIPVRFREGSPAKRLWGGNYYMTASQTATLNEPVSKQLTGIVLVFSRYSDGESRNEQFSSFFVPKYLVTTHPGCGHDFKLGGIFNTAAKYLYIHDDKIVGHEQNTQSVTVGGITYTNNTFVLRYVIGV